MQQVIRRETWDDHEPMLSQLFCSEISLLATPSLRFLSWHHNCEISLLPSQMNVGVLSSYSFNLLIQKFHISSLPRILDIWVFFSIEPSRDLMNLENKLQYFKPES
eukprot:TRINITY_DN13537_c0_g1_i1.p1 TRINITY_DN13537_c0_g1~~TRINITY_DN13537_c0_g1_i1.p1  ORF type:complete len:106 (+),score=16.52 TRINITY_DN13537_c0_g1_i1:89-406(+)